MTRTSLFASFSTKPEGPTATASCQVADLPAPLPEPLPREQAERLAYLFRLSLRVGQVHPLAHLIEVHRTRGTP